MLTTIMRIQSLVFAVYGVTFFLVPDFTLDTIFGWETMSLFPRVIGAVFIGVAWLEWNVTNRIAEHRDLVWPFVAIPTLILIAFIWEQAADTYEGSDLFFWVSVAITAFFALGVSLAAMRSE
jgi:hypothetical protein